MRRKSKNASPIFFSEWQFLGAEIEKELHRKNAVIVPLKNFWLYDSFPQDQIKELNEIKEDKVWADYILVIMMSAIEPKALEIAFDEPKARVFIERFVAGFRQWPDLMPNIFKITRNKWHKKSPTYTDRIQKFIAITPWIKSDHKKPPVVNTPNVQDKDIAKAIEIRLGLKNSISARHVQDARYLMKSPKQCQLCISRELLDADKYLRSLGIFPYQ
jgi:hypothetical protein